MPSATEIDAVQARLDRLNARRTPPGGAGAAPARGRRRHPAAGSRLAALGVSVLSTGGLAAYFLGTAPAGGGVPITAASVVAQPSSPASSSSAKDAGDRSSTVDGATYSNRWGDVQVRVTFGADGSIAAVDAIQVPGGRSRSVRINERAVPRLEAEALAAQGAGIDTVSGATYTSADYRRSLQSAIDAARTAGLTGLG